MVRFRHFGRNLPVCCVPCPHGAGACSPAGTGASLLGHHPGLIHNIDFPITLDGYRHQIVLTCSLSVNLGHSQ